VCEDFETPRENLAEALTFRRSFKLGRGQANLVRLNQAPSSARPVPFLKSARPANLFWNRQHKITVDALRVDGKNKNGLTAGVLTERLIRQKQWRSIFI
jgi:hypothetical protein